MGDRIDSLRDVANDFDELTPVFDRHEWSLYPQSLSDRNRPEQPQIRSTWPSAGRFPAGSQPAPFCVAENQISHCAIGDSVGGVPADVATTEYGITARSIERDNPLLTKLVLEIADVRV